jgi:hypothetical protein
LNRELISQLEPLVERISEWKGQLVEVVEQITRETRMAPVSFIRLLCPVGLYLSIRTALSISLIALFKQVGSEKGTLVCQADDWLHKNQVAVSNGYYCSGLHPDSYGKFDRARWLETFRDWGWHGPKWERPPWKEGGPRQRGQRKSRK